VSVEFVIETSLNSFNYFDLRLRSRLVAVDGWTGRNADIKDGVSVKLVAVDGWTGRNADIKDDVSVNTPKVVFRCLSYFGDVTSDDNEAPSFLEFCDELSDNEDLTKAQRKNRGMFKCLNRYVGTITTSSKTNSSSFKRKTARMCVKYPAYVNLTSSSKEQPNERTPSPPLRKKCLSPPQALSKSISSKSTHYTSSSSSPTPSTNPPNTLDGSSYGGSVGRSSQLSGTAFEFQRLTYK
nr:hypothetical protein [Tanacetum cinerariifolium]